MVFSPAISALQSSLGAGKALMAAQENVRVVEGVDAERSLDTCCFGCWAWVEKQMKTMTLTMSERHHHHHHFDPIYATLPPQTEEENGHVRAFSQRLILA